MLGVDIVYCRNTMDPSIGMLVDMLKYPKVTCWLSTHTIQTHLPNFFQKWEQSSYSLQVDMVAYFELPDNKMEAVQTSIIAMLDTLLHHQQIQELILIFVFLVVELDRLFQMHQSLQGVPLRQLDGAQGCQQISFVSTIFFCSLFLLPLLLLVSQLNDLPWLW